MGAAIVYSLLLLSNIPLDNFSTIYSTVSGYLGCFHLYFAVMNNVALNNLMQVCCV